MVCNSLDLMQIKLLHKKCVGMSSPTLEFLFFVNVLIVVSMKCHFFVAFIEFSLDDWIVGSDPSHACFNKMCFQGFWVFKKYFLFFTIEELWEFFVYSRHKLTVMPIKHKYFSQFISCLCAFLAVYTNNQYFLIFRSLRNPFLLKY